MQKDDCMFSLLHNISVSQARDTEALCDLQVEEQGESEQTLVGSFTKLDIMRPD